MGHEQISYISNGRVHKSDEIAEEKYLRGRIDLVKNININNIKKNLIRLYKSNDKLD